MNRSQVSRRDFHKWTMAAFGGLVAGAAGCGGDDAAPGGNNAAPSGGNTQSSGGPPAGSGTQAAGGDAVVDTQEILLDEPHVCRGLNACKELGADKKNACAGQGTCATAAPHSCHAANECKGQGGCGESVGRNACKQKGECGVPLSDSTWQRARQAFEQAMKASDKTFGEAPPKS